MQAVTLLEADEVFVTESLERVVNEGCADADVLLDADVHGDTDRDEHALPLLDTQPLVDRESVGVAVPHVLTDVERVSDADDDSLSVSVIVGHADDDRVGLAEADVHFEAEAQGDADNDEHALGLGDVQPEEDGEMEGGKLELGLFDGTLDAEALGLVLPDPDAEASEEVDGM